MQGVGTSSTEWHTFSAGSMTESRSRLSWLMRSAGMPVQADSTLSTSARVTQGRWGASWGRPPRRTFMSTSRSRSSPASSNSPSCRRAPGITAVHLWRQGLVLDEKLAWPYQHTRAGVMVKPDQQ